ASPRLSLLRSAPLSLTRTRSRPRWRLRRPASGSSRKAADRTPWRKALAPGTRFPVSQNFGLDASSAGTNSLVPRFAWLGEMAYLIGGLGMPVDVLARALEPGSHGAEDHFRTLVDALPTAIYTTDATGVITYFNEAAAKFWGHRPEIGKDCWCGAVKLYWPDGTPLPHDQCPMAIAVKEGQSVRGAEAIAERPDGTRIPFAPHPTPMFDQSGKLIGAVNMLFDISAHKTTEAGLQRAMDRGRLVEGVLAERAHEQSALYQFTDRLQRASTPRDIYDAALDSITFALRCDRASILLFDNMGVMRFAAWRGLSDGYRWAVEGHSPWTRDVKNPEPVCI